MRAVKIDFGGELKEFPLGVSILLYGSVASGKTTFSLTLAREFLKNNLPCIWVCVDESPKSIKGSYNDVLKELELKIPKFTLRQYIDYHCGLLGIDFKYRELALYIGNNIQRNLHISGKDPVGYSAAIIRRVTGITRKELSKKLFVSEPVITWRYNELKRFFK